MYYQELSKKIFLFCTTVIFLSLNGCYQYKKVYNQTEGNVAEVALRTEQARKMSDAAIKPIPSLVVNEGLYVDKTPISLARQPSWLKNRIVLHGQELPFSYYSRTIVNEGARNVLTHYQLGLDPSVNVAMNYSGSLQGALDLLAAKTGYIYVVNGNDIYWQAYVTKTFDIAFMPGSSDYMMGKASGSSSISSQGSKGPGSSNTVTAIIDDSSAAQYSNLKATLSVWKDVENSVKQLLSPEGKVMVSEATTSVTIRDRPANVRLAGKFIANLNANLSKQVLVKVQVLTVTLNNSFNYGIDWTAVKHTLGSNFLLNANYGTPISVTNLGPFATTAPFPGTGVAGQPGLSQVGVQNPGHSTGVTAIINALSQQGKVAVVTEPRVVALNNQVSVIRIVNQEGYLASVENTTVAGVAGGGSAGTITSQLTPGTLITGLTLYILPKIMGNKVFLQVNADLSNKISIDTISSGQTGNTTAPVIQVPRLTQKQFNQRSVIGSGDTLILSGFRQIQNAASAMQLFDSQALGGKASLQDNTETILLITPIILHGCA